jgi:hypothetical protein
MVKHGVWPVGRLNKKLEEMAWIFPGRTTSPDNKRQGLRVVTRLRGS